MDALHMIRAGWALIIKREEGLIDAIKEVIFLDSSITLEQLKPVLEKATTATTASFTLIPLVNASMSDVEEIISSTCWEYPADRDIKVEKFTITAGEIITI